MFGIGLTVKTIERVSDKIEEKKYEEMRQKQKIEELERKNRQLQRDAEYQRQMRRIENNNRRIETTQASHDRQIFENLTESENRIRRNIQSLTDSFVSSCPIEERMRFYASEIISEYNRIVDLFRNTSYYVSDTTYKSLLRAKYNNAVNDLYRAKNRFAQYI